MRFFTIGIMQANLQGRLEPQSSPRAIPSPLAIVVELRKLPLYLISVTSLTYITAPGTGRESNNPVRNLPRKIIQSYWLAATRLQLSREAQAQSWQAVLRPILSGTIEPKKEPVIWPRTRALATQEMLWAGTVRSWSATNWLDRAEVKPTS